MASLASAPGELSTTKNHLTSRLQPLSDRQTFVETRPHETTDAEAVAIDTFPNAD